jgi:hypothetical protein
MNLVITLAPVPRQLRPLVTLSFLNISTPFVQIVALVLKLNLLVPWHLLHGLFLVLAFLATPKDMAMASQGLGEWLQTALCLLVENLYLPFFQVQRGLELPIGL